jgi:hypothetical protein
VRNNIRSNERSRNIKRALSRATIWAVQGSLAGAYFKIIQNISKFYVIEMYMCICMEHDSMNVLYIYMTVVLIDCHECDGGN